MKKILLAALCATLTLAACGDKATDTTQAASSASAAATNACTHPDLDKAIQTQASKHFETIRQLAQQSDLYDESKLTSLFGQFDIQVSGNKIVQDSCQAQLTISIPENVFNLANTNAPLAQKETPQTILSNNTQAGNIRFDGQKLSLPLNFSTEINNGTFAIATKDENLKSAMRLLADALSPYGIKDNITYQGKIMSRQAALNLINNPKPIVVASAPAPIETLEEVKPIGNDIPAPPRPEDLQAADGDAPEVLQPAEPAKARVSDDELNQARSANEQADQSIKSAWKKIDPEIQKSLVEEQRSWESKKRQNCRSAGAKGGDAAEIQYLQMQCDTRLTRERVQYLKGYSIE